MATNRCIRFVVRTLQFLLVASVVVTMVLPETREVHILVARALLHIPTQRTIAQGQPRGCVVNSIPNVRFTENHQTRLSATTHKLPSAYVIARHTFYPRSKAPSPRVWQNHPMAVWAAFTATGDVLRNAAWLDDGSTLADGLADAGLIQQFADAMTVVKNAQHMAATNGALWLAESALHFALGREDAAFAALITASEKPNWYVYSSPAFGQVVEQLMRHGLPRYDAVLAIYRSGAWYDARRAMRNTRTELHRLMTEALQRRDQPRLTYLANLLRGLQGGTWQSFGMTNMFRYLRTYSEDTDFLDVMARQCGIQFPVDEQVEYHERLAIRLQFLQDHLACHLDPQLAAELLICDAEFREHRDKKFSYTYDPIDRPYCLSCMCGAACLLLLALGIGAIISEIPFLFRSQPFILNQKPVFPRSLGVCLAAGAATTLMALMVFSAFHSVDQPVRLSVVSDEPLLTKFQEHMLVAAGFSLLWMAARWLTIASRTDQLAYSMLALIVGNAYVATIVLCTFYRHQCMRAVIDEIMGGSACC